jgi:hypothetical protein
VFILATILAVGKHPGEYTYNQSWSRILPGDIMKAKLTVTLDLRGVTSDQGTFSQRWRGKFEPAGRDDERYKALSAKYL